MFYSIDQDEPPDLGDTLVYDPFYAQLHPEDDDQYYFDPEHAATSADTLKKAFKVK